MTRRSQKAALVPDPSAAQRLEPEDDTPQVGSWWWVTAREDDDADDASKESARLACVVDVGSNYAAVEGYEWRTRIALDHFHQRCQPANDPSAYVQRKIAHHREHVRVLMDKIRTTCHRLGVPVHRALGEGPPPSDQALAVAHGVGDAKKYQRDLIKAKEKTLPELFKQVQDHHDRMAKWMRVELIPSQAELRRVQGVTDVLEAKIRTVELYAGLTEELTQVREGDPASLDDKVHLMQRRHYMDEECLARYEAGGMTFEEVGDFDRWLGRSENFTRLFPHPRTIVAFRIRRYDRRSDDNTIEAFIRLHFENQQNKRTFLYVRNGQQLWRVETSIDFDEELFPKQEDNLLLSDEELWIKGNGRGFLDLVPARQVAAMHDHHARKRRYAARKLWQWHRAGCPDDDQPPWMYIIADGDLFEHEPYTNGRKPGSQLPIEGRPHVDWDLDWSRDPSRDYQQLTPAHIYYDDAMRRVREVANEHNRIAVIVQGLLDRSVCLHPHPPWKIWTPEGFRAGIELVYDISRGLTSGEPIDFKAYRQRLNQSIRPGCYTIGQYQAWLDWMMEQYGSKWREHARGGWGNSGPPNIARVHRVRRDGSCEFRWTRDRVKPKWVRDPDRPGYLKPSYPPIPVKWICPRDRLTCVDAYTPGDYRLFYDDPRTRKDYIRWAPILLSAENWHARRRQAVTDDDEGDDE